jgi:hypothetical protein
MHVARWTRIGMLISGAWIVGATTCLAYADIRAGRFLRNSAFEVCDYVNYHVRHYASCWRDLMKVAAFVDHPWANVAVISLAPILLVWLGAHVTLRLWRWVHSF